MVVYPGLPYPYWGAQSDSFTEAILQLTSDGYIEQVGSVDTGNVLGYDGSSYFLLAPLSYYTFNAGLGDAPAICTLDEGTSAVSCSVAGYTSVYATTKTADSIDYILYWTNQGSGTPSDFVPASMTYEKVDCPAA